MKECQPGLAISTNSATSGTKDQGVVRIWEWKCIANAVQEVET